MIVTWERTEATLKMRRLATIMMMAVMLRPSVD